MSSDADKPKCGARTRNGGRCSKRPIPGGTRCAHHSFKVPGRPRKVTPELVEELLDLIIEGNYIETATQAVGISRSTYYAWLRRGDELEAAAREQMEDDDEDVYAFVDPADWPLLDFSHTMKTAEAYSEAELVRMVHRLASSGAGSWTGFMTILERRFPSRWGRRKVLDHNLNVDGGVDVRSHVRVLVPSDAERAPVLRALLASGALDDVEAELDQGEAA